MNPEKDRPAAQRHARTAKPGRTASPAAKRPRKPPEGRPQTSQAKDSPAADAQATANIRSELLEASRRELELVRGQARHEVSRARDEFGGYGKQWRIAFNRLVAIVAGAMLVTWIVTWVVARATVGPIARRAARNVVAGLPEPEPRIVERIMERTVPQPHGPAPADNRLAVLETRLEESIRANEALLAVGGNLAVARRGSRKAFEALQAARDDPHNAVARSASAAVEEVTQLLIAYREIPAKPRRGLFGSRRSRNSASIEGRIRMLHGDETSADERRALMKEIAAERSAVSVPLLIDSIRDSDNLFGCAAACGVLEELTERGADHWLDFAGWIAWWDEETTPASE